MAFDQVTTTFQWHVEDWQYHEGNYDTESTLTEVRRIRKIDGSTIATPTLAELGMLISENVLPEVAKTKYLGGTLDSTNRLLQTMICRSVSIRHDPTARSLLATCVFHTRWCINPAKTTPLFLPATYTEAAVFRVGRIYRQTWTVAPPTTSDTSADIGGTAVGGNGASTNVQVPQSRIKLRFISDATLAGFDRETQANALNAYIGKINSTTFAGFPAGSVICEDASISDAEHPFYENQLTFLVDDWAHHEQVAEVGTDGRPNWNAGNLATVQWKRIPRTSIDFGLIWGNNAQIRDRLFKGNIL
jgi:hypothetical protein